MGCSPDQTTAAGAGIAVAKRDGRGGLSELEAAQSRNAGSMSQIEDPGADRRDRRRAWAAWPRPARWRRAAMRSSLFEKNAWLGGKAAVLSEDGFRFDMGPTILLMPSVLAADLRRGRPRPRRRARPDPARPAMAVVLRRTARPSTCTPTPDGWPRRSTRSPPAGPRAGLSQVSRPLGAARRHLRALLLLAVDRLGPRHVRPDDGGRACRRWATCSRMRPWSTVGATIRGHVARRPRRPDARPLHAVRRLGARPLAGRPLRHRPHADGRGRLVSAGRHPRRRRGPGPAGRRAGRRVPHRGGGPVDPHRRRRRASSGVELDDGERVPLAAVVSNCDAVRTHRELLGRHARGPPVREAPRATSRPARAWSSTWASIAATSTCCTTTSSSRAIRTRSSTSSTARASRPPTRPATSVRPGRHRARRRPARRRGALRPRPHALPAAPPRLEGAVPRLPPDDPRQAQDDRRARRPREPDQGASAG